MDKEIIKHYTNGELTIVWKPSACIHSKNCWNSVTGMPQVFDPRKRPWITMIGGPSSEAIAAQVATCPSGALSTYYNNEEQGAKAGIEGIADENAGSPAEAHAGNPGEPHAANEGVSIQTSGVEQPVAGGPLTEPAASVATRIKVLPNGPLIVHGLCEVEDSAGNLVEKTNVTAFCRCGYSANKPYCDGSHGSKGFVG